jgi:hypothetical protein
MTQETSAANQVLEGLEQHSKTGSEPTGGIHGIFRPDSQVVAEDLELDLDVSYPNRTEDYQREEDQENQTMESSNKPIESFLDEHATFLKNGAETKPTDAIKMIENDKISAIIIPLSQVQEAGEPIVDHEAITSQAIKLAEENKNNLEFRAIAKRDNNLETILTSGDYCIDDSLCLGRRLLVLPNKERTGFSVFAMSQECKRVDVTCYLAARDEPFRSQVALVHIMDNPEEDFSLIFCVVRHVQGDSSNDHTVLVYKVTENLEVSLLDYEFGLECFPKKIVSNQTWCCINDNKELQRFRLLHYYEPAKVGSPEKIGEIAQESVIVSQVINLESSSKLRELDVSSIDGLLLLTFDQGIGVANSLGSQFKLGRTPEQKDDVICAKFLRLPTKSSQPEFFISIELSVGHIYSITDRNIGSFKTCHIQSFSIPIGLGGPKDIMFSGNHVFLNENLLIIFFHGDFYFVAFHINLCNSGTAARPTISGNAKANINHKERDHLIRFVETDLGHQIPICICKNFESTTHRFAYRLEGLVGEGVFNDSIAKEDGKANSSQVLAEVCQGLEPQSPQKKMVEPEIGETFDLPIQGERGCNEHSSMPDNDLEVDEEIPPLPTDEATSPIKKQVEKDDADGATEIAVPKEDNEGGPTDATLEFQNQEGENASESDDEAAEEMSRKSQESKQDSKRDSQDGNSPSDSCQDLKDTAADPAISHQKILVQSHPDHQRTDLEKLDMTKMAYIGTGHFIEDESNPNLAKNISQNKANEGSDIGRNEKNFSFNESSGKAHGEVKFDTFYQEYIMETSVNQDDSRRYLDEDKDYTRSVPIEVSPISEAPIMQIDSKKEHKTHSVTPVDHGVQKKLDLNQNKNLHSKKPDKNDHKKRGRPRKERESEHANGSKKFPEKEKLRSDKYKDDFVPKDTIYREKDQKDKEKAKETIIFNSNPQHQDRYNPKIDDVDYVPKIKDTPTVSNTSEKYVLKETKSTQEEKKPEPKEIKEAVSEDIRPFVESLLETKLERIDSGIKGLLEKEVKKEEVLKGSLRDVIENLVDDKLIKVLKENFNCLMSNNFNEVFEELVVPIFEKYLTKVFDKTNSIFEKGLKFYVDKLSIEERKASQLKDQFSVMMNQFLSNSKVFSKATQDFAQVSKDITLSQNKDLNKRLTDLEEKMDKFSEKQDRILDMMEKVMANQQKSLEEDKKIDVPPAFKDVSPAQSQRENSSSMSMDNLSEQLKSLISALQYPNPSPFNMPPPAPSIPSSDMYRGHPGQYMIPQPVLQYHHPGASQPIVYPYMNQHPIGNSYSSNQASVGSNTPLPQQIVKPSTQQSPSNGNIAVSEGQLRDLLSLLKPKEGDKE